MLSGITPFHFPGLNCFVKRDELIDPLLSGNKYRKLYTLLQTPPETYNTIISYGGTQSNAMLSIAALCQQKGWKFEYYCKPLPNKLKTQPLGNLKMALHLGIRLIATEDYKQTINQLQSHGKTLLIPQGGADPLAEQGITALADEIKQWQTHQGVQDLHVVTPSGTGTTAFYLAKHLSDCRVLTTALVGDNVYLQQQMQLLGTMPNNLKLLEPKHKYRFAKPYPEFLETYQSLKQAGIEFDLLYAPLMWQTLLNHKQEIQGTILYVHSGGLLGNASMLQRYT
ncbi:pyridoxal-phosphate dependent enzyme [Ghiorsea bivora]|uniref:pyridoxal-phosphate dependent enzyme n=1 Tax=Ghiorsea bivora TaxID=1485545 RepID=UPI00056E5656|nr:pyridoxal-phosphate dependent enzyme [Ghiorsea bivora]